MLPDEIMPQDDFVEVNKRKHFSFLIKEYYIIISSLLNIIDLTLEQLCNKQNIIKGKQ